MMKVKSFCLITCVLLLLADMVLGADKPKLRQGMNLVQAREALMNAGWIVPYSIRSKCLSNSGMRDNTYDVGNCDGMYSDEFHLDFPEYEGGSLNGSVVWGVYKDGYGDCLEVAYGYSEEFYDSKDLAKHIAVDSWKLKKCEQ